MSLPRRVEHDPSVVLWAVAAFHSDGLRWRGRQFIPAGCQSAADFRVTAHDIASAHLRPGCSRTGECHDPVPGPAFIDDGVHGHGSWIRDSAFAVGRTRRGGRCGRYAACGRGGHRRSAPARQQYAGCRSRSLHCFRRLVPLQGGRNRLPVHVEDGDGNASDDLAEVLLDSEGIPLEFTFDPVLRQIVGLAPNIDFRSGGRVLVEYDTVTRTFELHQIGSATDFATSGHCYRSARREFLHLRFLFPIGFELIRYQLDARTSDVLLAFEFDPSDGYLGPSGNPVLVCGPDDYDAYMLANYSLEGDFDSRRSMIFRLQPTEGTATVLTETDLDAEPPWRAVRMAWSPEGLITMEDISAVAPLTRVDLLDGTRSDFTPGLDVGGLGLIAALPRIFVDAVEGLIEIDVTDTSMPMKRPVLGVPDDDELYPVLGSRFDYDPGADSLLVADVGYGALLEIDLDSGKPRMLLQLSLGSGPGLSGPSLLALTPDLSEIFVADQRRHQRLIQITLPSGDRRLLGTYPEQFSEDARGLALDSVRRRLYFANTARILAVDADSGAATTLAARDSAVGSGFPFGNVQGMLLDADGSRLIYVDVVHDALVALDPISTVRSVVSRSGERGAGPPLDNPVGIVFDAIRNVFFVTNQRSGNLMRIDPETGDRTIVLSNCPDPIGPDETLGGLTLHTSEDALRIYGDRRFRFDLESGGCEIVDESGPQWIESESGQIFAVGVDGIGQIDRESGEFVLISR